MALAFSAALIPIGVAQARTVDPLPPTAGYIVDTGMQEVSAGACTGGVLCGRIKNRDDRHRIDIFDVRPAQESRRRNLYPGRTSTTIYRDTDVFFVGCPFTLGYTVRYRAGYYNIYDGQYLQVTDIRC